MGMGGCVLALSPRRGFRQEWYRKIVKALCTAYPGTRGQRANPDGPKLLIFASRFAELDIGYVSNKLSRQTAEEEARVLRPMGTAHGDVEGK